MTPKKFDKIANELFGAVLEPHGFTNKESRHCTFYRKASEEIYHIIVPEQKRGGAWYDVKVFPSSDILEPLFKERFPDGLAIHTPAYLNKYSGVGLDPQEFNCKYEENFRRIFKKEVEPLLINNAILFLNKIEKIRNFINLLRIDFARGFALKHVGELEEAKKLLLSEKERISNLDQDDKVVSVTLGHINKLLADL